ncbi:Imm1 family immunity protein [Amycolatopsis sp. NPDC051373]|uniref:Imm1 family immunity protein n=1 Tax=Amycolatopsis sp. NPDC051373 TaxID=3155801 RepID=UPI00344F1851
MQYADDATFVVTDGDPAPPAALGDADFSVGTGLPIAQVVTAVQEFVRTGKLPETVPWREV